MTVAIVGAGPAGLIAAEILAGRGVAVTLCDHMPSAGRKFLLAGRGGLNLTHSEPLDAFLARYATMPPILRAAIEAWPPEALQAWCEGLGQPVFRGSSGRIFPTALKAAPLLRAWVRRLDSLGVIFHSKYRWTGWDTLGEPRFSTPQGTITFTPRATLLALGGASWPRMGSDGAWTSILRAQGVTVSDLQPSNCGVRIDWAAPFLARHEGAPLKRIALSCGGRTQRGEAVITTTGLEGGAVYALSPAIREGLAHGSVEILVDLRPDLDDTALAARLAAPRRARSLTNFLRQEAGLSPAAAGLVQNALHDGATAPLAALIRAAPLKVTALQPIARAVSSAGGIAFAELEPDFMLRRLPGVFAAGEMLDWEAPTGGYLLQACFSTGAAAAAGILRWLATTP